MSFLTLLAVFAAVPVPGLEDARDRQDRASLEQIVTGLSQKTVQQPDHAQSQYQLALAQSYLAEVATEVRDKARAKKAAEAGIQAAERAVALDSKNPEHHRILGTLCGQVIPANVLLGMRYGRCALESINKAIELDPGLALAYVSRGVGNYYLPPAFGGGAEAAIQDFNKALQLNPNLAEAHLWLGIALRKSGRNGEARASLEKALQLNPKRIWAKQQLEKTPSQ
jgi:tetratricopeptide (TPR) repeat protein